MVTPEEDESKTAEQRVQDAWDTARYYLSTAAAAGVDPRRAVWPVSKEPTGNHAAALSAHTSIIQYRDELHIYRDERNDVRELWDEEIATVPAAGDDHSVSLSSLQEWSSRYVTQTREEISSVHGKQEKEESYRMLLPLPVSQEVYRKLCDIAFLLGLAADIDTSEKQTEIDAELLEEVSQWRQQNI